MAACHTSVLHRQYHSSLNEESFLNGTAACYMEELFNVWLKDHSSVHASWNTYFSNVMKGESPCEAPGSISHGVS